jgi:hypothetical protein
MMVYTCNPSYSGGRDQEDFGSSTAQAKKKVSEISTNKLDMDMVVCTCNPSYMGAISRRTEV